MKIYILKKNIYYSGIGISLAQFLFIIVRYILLFLVVSIIPGDFEEQKVKVKNIT